ncbi:MAG: hypothetical protein NTZ49_00880 [Candidatus Parcubacteria bacterium]|nr:hypothetical protein [Candidatus Parcubacteria bacterium]
MHFPKELLASALEVIKKGGEISENDWGGILSNLKKALHPYLSQIANKPLGDINILECSAGNSIKDKIKPDDICCGSIMNPLKIPGLWLPAILMPRKEKNDTDCVFVWGITRNDDWAQVKIICDLRYETPPTIYDFDIESMKIAFSWPLEISENCGLTLEQMFEQILKAVADWAERRRKLAYEAEIFNLSLQGVKNILFD